MQYIGPTCAFVLLRHFPVLQVPVTPVVLQLVHEYEFCLYRIVFLSVAVPASSSHCGNVSLRRRSALDLYDLDL